MSVASVSTNSRRTIQKMGATLPRWLLPTALLLTFVGYVAAWVDHRVAGLVITGLDLGEYVKFLTSVRSGEIVLWREGFYLPLVAVSLTASLATFRRELHYAWPVCAALLALAIVAALNLLPPAWTPQRMMTEEFRQQALALFGCLAAMAFSPLLALLPVKGFAVIVAALGVSAAIVPAHQFMLILPAISQLYNHFQSPAWGLFLCVAGLLAVATTAVWVGWSGRLAHNDA